MSANPMDINDDEIRVIAPGESPRGVPPERRRHRWWLWIAAALAVVVAAALAVALLPGEAEDETGEEDSSVPDVTAAEETAVMVPVEDSVKAFTSVTDTIVDNVPLTILTPVHSRPELVVGREAVDDSTTVLAMQAADVRGDNGMIAGAYVLKGELLSKGKAKAGFCSIIDGNMTIGVADATPLLEQALEQEGYFFRQYPLVVGGQIVENKPRGRAIRKALAELDGRFAVVISGRALTFHDFAQTLVDLGARNAIYLVGGGSRGFYVDETGHRTDISPADDLRWENVNFIIWR